MLEEMGRAFTYGHLPAMRKGAVYTWEMGHSQMRGIGIEGTQQRSINAPFTSAHDAGSGSSAPMKAIVMAGELRGKGSCVIYVCGMGLTMRIQGLFCLFLQPLALLIAPRFHLSAWATYPHAYGLSLAVLGFNSIVSSISASDIETLLGSATMVWPRQRMLIRRGTSRGGSLRPPVVEDSPHHCHCHCPRTQGASLLRSNQFLDAGAPGSSSSPSFGSTIFNFNNSLNHPEISAHVLVLSNEETQDEGDSRAHRGTMPSNGSAKSMETPSVDPVNVSNRPFVDPMSARETMIS